MPPPDPLVPTDRRAQRVARRGGNSSAGETRRGAVSMTSVISGVMSVVTAMTLVTTLVMAVFVSVVASGGVARADPAVDEALSIVDDAILAIDMQDGSALQDAMNRAVTTGSWLPSITVESIQTADRDALVLIWLGLYLPSGEAFLVASDVVEMERGARRWGLPGDPDSDAAIETLDLHASALLEIFDHRGLPLTNASRTVMARNATSPEFETFDIAITDLRAQAAIEPFDDDWVPPPLSVPMDDPMTLPTVPATVVVTAPPATAPPATAPAATLPPVTAPPVTAPPASVPASPPIDASGPVGADAADPTVEPTDAEATDASTDVGSRPARIDVPPENFDDVAEIGRIDATSPNATGEPDAAPDTTATDAAVTDEPDATNTNETVPADAQTGGAGETGVTDGRDADRSPVSGSAMLALAAIAVLAVIMSTVSIVRSRRHAHLSAIAYSDALTGLNNRRRFDADVHAMSARGSAPTAMLMLDVDHFKRFNDTFGHAVGDDVLRRVGDVFSRTVRANDVAYRYGGEEFCALLPDTTQADAMAIAERVRRAIEAIELRLDDGSTVSITASVGVSCGPAEQLTGLVRRADEAVYRAKDDGRNRVAAG